MILYTSERLGTSVNFPVLIYDDLCASCVTYAKIVNKLVSGKITIIGHYSEEGKRFKSKIFPQGYEGLEMSWFVTQDMAHGGSEGLRRLLRYVFSASRFKSNQDFQKNKFYYSKCFSDCKSAQGVMFRSLSILKESKTIPINVESDTV